MYEVGNGGFRTYEEAMTYCDTMDFDFHEMIVYKEEEQMIITESEYREYIVLVEGKIMEYAERYNKLQSTLNNWNDFFNPTSKASGLTQEEIKELQNSYKQQQHEYFLKWYRMNNNLRDKGLSYYTAQKIRDIGVIIS